MKSKICALCFNIWQSRVVELRGGKDFGQYHRSREKNINRLESIEEEKQCA